MKFFLFIFLMLLALATVGMLVLFYIVGKGIRFFRRFSSGELSGEEFERMANKHFHKQKGDGIDFDKDYFKGSAWRGNWQQSGQQQGSQQQRHTRTTRTSDGVTIVDHRDPTTANKKIFEHDEGEYVDFTEG